MRTSTRRLGLATTLALLLAAPAASAETFKTTYGAGQENAFAWEGEAAGFQSVHGIPVGPYSGVSNNCFNGEFVEGQPAPAPHFRCDLVVYEVKDAGELEASVTLAE